jgi:hypothetical protein
MLSSVRAAILGSGRRVAAADAPRVVVQPTKGLANRLRALVSCQAIAEVHRLRFAVLWEPGPGFSDDPWNALFANELPLLSRPEFEEILKAGTPVASDWFQHTPEQAYRLRPQLEVGGFLAALQSRGFVYDGAFRDLLRVLKRSGLEGSRMRKYRRRRKLLYRGLRLAPILAKPVEEFANRHFSEEPVVGVHIRRGDAISGPLREHFVWSSDEAFEREIDDILSAEPATRFFLATDCGETQERFCRRYPGRMLTYSKSFVDSTYDAVKLGQPDAAIELFLLSRTRRVLGTAWSSFGEVAAYIGGIPVRAAGSRKKKR